MHDWYDDHWDRTDGTISVSNKINKCCPTCGRTYRRTIAYFAEEIINSDEFKNEVKKKINKKKSKNNFPEHWNEPWKKKGFRKFK